MCARVSEAFFVLADRFCYSSASAYSRLHCNQEDLCHLAAYWSDLLPVLYRSILFVRTQTSETQLPVYAKCTEDNWKKQTTQTQLGWQWLFKTVVLTSAIVLWP